MKHFIILILCATFAIKASALDQCLILDIDETLVKNFMDLEFSTTGKSGVAKYIEQKKVIDSIGGHYFIFPGAKELVHAALDIHKFKIKFFSAGIVERNEDLIQKFLASFLPPDIIWTYKLEGQFEIFSRDHLRRLENNETLFDFHPLSMRISFTLLKKDLTTIGCDLNESVIIDDDLQYSLRGQEKNLLYIPSGFSPQDFFEQNYKTLKGTEQWFALNHLHYAAGILWEAMEQAKSNRNSLTEELHRFQFNFITGEYDYNEVSKYPFYYEKGLRILSPYESSTPGNTNQEDLPLLERSPVPRSYCPTPPIPILPIPDPRERSPLSFMDDSDDEDQSDLELE